MKPTRYDLEHGHPRHRCDNASVFDLAMQGDVRVIPCLSSLLTQGAVTILQQEGKIRGLEDQLGIEMAVEQKQRFMDEGRQLVRTLAKLEYDRGYHLIRKRKALAEKAS